PNHFLGIIETRGLDGAKVGILDLAYGELRATKKDKKEAAADFARELKTTLTKLSDARDERQRQLVYWWETANPYVPVDGTPVEEAGLFGGRMALLWTAIVPAVMAVLYLLLIVYFRVQGGYGKVELERSEPALTPR